MAFRDEEEALRAKKAALEEQLAETREELEELRPQVARLETLERELAETTAELERLRGPEPKRSSNIPLPAVVGAVVALLAVAGAVAGILVLRRGANQDAEWAAVRAEQTRRLAAEEEARLAAEAARAAEEARAAEAARAAEEAARVAEEALAPPARRTGRVIEVSGAAPATAEAECSLVIHPQSRSRFQARLVVECAGRVIYGRPGQGYVPCTMSGADIERCEDRNGTNAEGDPMVILDLPTDTLVVSDGPELPWTVRIALDPVED